jgi:Flp pilus assembly protein protease CpaA
LTFTTIKSFLPLIFFSAAAFTDAGTNRIPNALIFFGCGAGALVSGPVFPLRFLPALFLLFPLYRLRLLGAGDIKLLAVTSGFFPPAGSVRILFYGLLFASLPAVFLLGRKRHARIPLAPFFLSGYAFFMAAGNILF